MTKIAKVAANNFKQLVLLVIVSWLTAAVVFFVFEHVNPLDALYWSMTTMSTVGYGDISAATWGGKIVTIIFQAWSIFYLVPCAVALIIDNVRIDQHQFTDAEQNWTEDSLKKIANKIGVTLDEAPEDYIE